MTDQTAPAWFPPAAAPSQQGIPLEPPAAAYAPGATPAVAPGWASAPAPAPAPIHAPAPLTAPPAPDADLVFQSTPTMAYSPVLQASPESPSAPMHVDGPVPTAAIPSHLLPTAGALMIDGAPASAPAHAPHDPTISFASTPAMGEPAVAQAAATSAEPAAATAPQTEAAAVAGADATGTWWSPGTALVVAMVALAWQLVATYARERLPARLASGQPIDRFDSIVDRLPLADGVGGQAVGFLLIAAAGTLVYLGFLRGVREPGLQFAIGIVAGLALLLPMLLAAL